MRKYFIILILLITFGCRLSLLAQERAVASYYSNRMHGRRMSNGEKYHRDSMTCAHAKYALGTLLRVTNVKNGKSVVVRVTDRCARHARRIIDLSMAAAKQLGLVAAGVGTVLVERFHRKNEIPYRGDDDVELPEFDLEVTKPADGCCICPGAESGLFCFCQRLGVSLYSRYFLAFGFSCALDRFIKKSPVCSRTLNFH